MRLEVDVEYRIDSDGIEETNLASCNCVLVSEELDVAAADRNTSKHRRFCGRAVKSQVGVSLNICRKACLKLQVRNRFNPNIQTHIAEKFVGGQGSRHLGGSRRQYP